MLLVYEISLSKHNSKWKRKQPLSTAVYAENGPKKSHFELGFLPMLRQGSDRKLSIELIKFKMNIVIPGQAIRNGKKSQ